MDGADHVFENVIKEHHLGNSNIEEDLQIAAKLGNVLLQQNNEITEKNRQLWSSNEEYKKEIVMLRQQNNLLRKDAEIKSADQIQLDMKLTEMTSKVKRMDKEMCELQSLLNSMSLSMSETETLCDQETMRANMLEIRLAEVQSSQDMTCTTPPSPKRCLSPSPLRDRTTSHIQNLLNRSEKERQCLEDEIQILLEENCDLLKRVKCYEAMQQDTPTHSVIENRISSRIDSSIDNSINNKIDNTPNELDLSKISTTTLDTTTQSECDTVESLTSDSWLAEKLTVLEERYNQACESCICGACESPHPDSKDGSIINLSYRELFDQLFDALNTTKIRTPYGTLKRRSVKKLDYQ